MGVDHTAIAGYGIRVEYEKLKELALNNGMVKESIQEDCKSTYAAELHEWVYDYFSSEYKGDIDFDDYGNHLCEDYDEMTYVFLAKDPILRMEKFIEEVKSLGIDIDLDNIEKISEVKTW